MKALLTGIVYDLGALPTAWTGSARPAVAGRCISQTLGRRRAPREGSRSRLGHQGGRGASEGASAATVGEMVDISLSRVEHEDRAARRCSRPLLKHVSKNQTPTPEMEHRGGGDPAGEHGARGGERQVCWFVLVFPLRGRGPWRGGDSD